MAMPDVSAVSKLSNKCYFLMQKGHNARAAEKYEQAAAAAAALPDGADSLVVATLRQMHAAALVNHARVSSMLPMPERAALERRVFLELLPQVMAIIDRRAAAGSLLGAHACRPTEVAWACADEGFKLSHATSGDAQRPARSGAPPDPMLGYVVLLRVAGFALDALGNSLLRPLSAAHVDAHVAFVCRAVDALVQPHGEESLAMSEAEFVQRLQYTMSELLELPARARQPLANASARVEAARRGALRARGLDESMRHFKDENARLYACASAAREQLRCCSLAACGKREEHAAQWKLCSACKAACYCCKEHQAADWKAGHKAACAAARGNASAQGRA
jgi:hypothetical protein